MSEPRRDSRPCCSAPRGTGGRRRHGGARAATLAALLAPVIAPGDPLAQSLDEGLSGPTAAHSLGQDKFGRDVLSRLIHGARLSLAVVGHGVHLPADRAGRRLAGGVPGRFRGPALPPDVRRPAGLPRDPPRHRDRGGEPAPPSATCSSRCRSWGGWGTRG